MALPEHGIILPTEVSKRLEPQKLGPFRVREIDRDPERIAITDFLVADGYRPLFRDPTEAELEDLVGFNQYVQQKLIERVVNDPYRQRGTTIPLAVELEAYHLVANMRLGFGKKDPFNRFLPLEVMCLVEPVNDWDNLLSGLGEDEVGEIGRVTVVEDYRSDENTPKILGGMLKRAGEIFKRKGVKKGIMVMQNKLRRHIVNPVKDLGISLDGPIPMRLRADDKEAAGTFDEFSKYWRDPTDPPQLYVFDFRNNPSS